MTYAKRYSCQIEMMHGFKSTETSFFQPVAENVPACQLVGTSDMKSTIEQYKLKRKNQGSSHTRHLVGDNYLLSTRKSHRSLTMSDATVLHTGIFQLSIKKKCPPRTWKLRLLAHAGNESFKMVVSKGKTGSRESRILNSEREDITYILEIRYRKNLAGL